jgi:muconate cycloisomerase
MRIRQLTATIVRLPLKRTFRHASATRQDSENVLVECQLTDGTVGWGEGVPRSYVTGETPEGCLAQLAATAVGDQFGADCSDWPDVVRLCGRFEPAIDRPDPRGCYGNALRCAVELSILDAFGRLFGEPVSAVGAHAGVPLPAGHDDRRKFPCSYSAVIDSGNHKLWRKALVRRLYGFRQCKVKVGAAGDDDAARLRTIRRWIGPAVDLRIDANEAWCARELRTKLAPLSECRISCVEQPVPHAEVTSLAALRGEIGIPVMLDESLTSITDAEQAIAAHTCDLFNIRLSKCGGFINSLRMAALARGAAIGYQLGCHPGETGILSAAGRHWVAAVPDVRYLEGSYDRYLFRRLLTQQDVTFGYGGRAPMLTTPGLGVTIDREMLAEVAVATEVCRVS